MIGARPIRNFYSAAQYDRMSELDENAVKRNENLESISMYICVDCGAIDRFMINDVVKYVVVKSDGMLILREASNGSSVAKIDDRINLITNHMREKGKTAHIECENCGGPAISRSIVNETCRERGCLGCKLCGKVSSKSEVIRKISSCPVCFGGDKMCKDGDNCPNSFMRIYYGIKENRGEDSV